MDGSIKEIEMAATGKSTAGSSVTAAAGTGPPAEGAKPKEAAKPVPAARRAEPDLEALEQGKPADVDCLEIARKSKWRGRCGTFYHTCHRLLVCSQMALHAAMDADTENPKQLCFVRYFHP